MYLPLQPAALGVSQMEHVSKNKKERKKVEEL